MEIYLLVFACTLSHAAYMGSRLTMSLYALDLGANQLAIGMLTALYALSPTLLSVYIGRLADRVGPRLPMLMGTMGTALALLLPPLFPKLATLYITALLIGASFGVFFVTLMGIAGGIGGDINRIRNYALVSIGFACASFLGPLIGGFSIDHFGHLPTFLLLSMFTLISFVILWFRSGFLPPAAKHNVTHGKESVLDLLRVSALGNVFVASGIISTAWDLFQFYMPVYGYAIGLSASAIGIVFGFFALATFFIRIVLPRLIKISSEAEILTYAIFVAAFAFVLFPFFKDVYALGAIAFLLGLGIGCGQPLSMSLIYALSPRERISESAGLRMTINNFTHFVIPLLFGSIGTAFGYFPVFISSFTMLAVVGLLTRRNITLDAGT